MGPHAAHPSPTQPIRPVFAVAGGTMKDGIANNSTASISQARKAVEQLKMEACMDRIKVRGWGAFQRGRVLLLNVT